MKIVIPLAGFGTRLRPHTFTKPKPMFSMAGKPFLGHLIDKLSVLPVTEWIFITGYLGDQVERYVTQELGLNAKFAVQNEMLGQSHAISLAREFIDDSPTFVVFADTLFDTDLTELTRTTADAVIFVKEVEDPRPFGVASLDSEGYITSFIEKPESMENRLAVVGMYWFKHGTELIKAIDEQIEHKMSLKNEYFIADAMSIMIEHKLKFRTQTIATWLDAGNPAAVLETNRYLLDNGKDNSAAFNGAKQSTIIAPCYIHPSATINGSVVGPYATIGANCKVTNSILRNSILDEAAEVTNSILDASLIGRKGKAEGHFRSVNIGDTSSVLD